MMKRTKTHLGRILVLVSCLGLIGCAASAKTSVRERELKRILSEDRQYTLEAVPLESPPQRAASFRIAAQGLRALEEGRMQEAEDKLEKALSLDPRNAFCYLYLAEIRFKGGEIEQALMLLNQSEVLFQGHPYWLSEVFARKGLYLEEMRSTDEARRAYRKALEYNPWNESSKKGLERVGPSRG